LAKAFRKAFIKTVGVMPDRKKCLETFIAFLDQIKNRNYTDEELSFIFRDGRVLRIKLNKEEIKERALKLINKDDEGKD
jgi:hypothetical protein